MLIHFMIRSNSSCIGLYRLVKMSHRQVSSVLIHWWELYVDEYPHARYFNFQNTLPLKLDLTSSSKLLIHSNTFSPLTIRQFCSQGSFQDCTDYRPKRSHDNLKDLSTLHQMSILSSDIRYDGQFPNVVGDTSYLAFCPLWHALWQCTCITVHFRFNEVDRIKCLRLILSYICFLHIT